MNIFTALLLQSTEINVPETFGLWSYIARIFFVIVMFVFVAFSAYYTTRFISTSKRKTGGAGNIKIVEGAAVGAQANIQLVCVAGKYFLIGVTKENVNFLTEISGDDINLSEPAKVFIPFESYLNKVFSRTALKADDASEHEDESGN
jgi:flagellar protein FliO/FliZ